MSPSLSLFPHSSESFVFSNRGFFELLPVIFLLPGAQSRQWYYVGSLGYKDILVLFVFILCAVQASMIYISTVNLTEAIWGTAMIHRFLFTARWRIILGILGIWSSSWHQFSYQYTILNGWCWRNLCLSQMYSLSSISFLFQYII